MALMIPVGPFQYRLHLHHGYIILDGRQLLGACDSDNQRILISDISPPAKRLATFWHEAAHAWFAELNPGSHTKFDEETFCNVIGLAMVAWGPHLMARVQIYLTRGIEPEDVMIMPGGSPVPIIRVNDSWQQCPSVDAPQSPSPTATPSP